MAQHRGDTVGHVARPLSSRGDDTGSSREVRLGHGKCWDPVRCVEILWKVANDSGNVVDNMAVVVDMHYLARGCTCREIHTGKALDGEMRTVGAPFCDADSWLVLLV